MVHYNRTKPPRYGHMTNIREFLSFSQKEMAKALGMSQAQYSLLERGLVPPSTSILEKLKSLGFLESFFSTPLLQGHDFHRSLYKLRVKVAEQINAQTTQCGKHILQIRELEPTAGQSKLPSFDNATTPQEAAKEIRKFFNIPTGPIPNLMKKVEETGLIIVPMNFKTTDTDAQTVFFDQSFKIIFINNKKGEGDRLRFSLAHELYHVLFHGPDTISTKEIEGDANAFGAELLLPEEEIKDELAQGLTLGALAELKKKWGVSIASLAYRAKTLQVYKEEEIQRFYMMLSRMGYRKQEPVHIPREEPSLMRTLLANISNKKGGLNGLADYFSISVDVLKQIYPPEVLPGG